MIPVHLIDWLSSKVAQPEPLPKMRNMIYAERPARLATWLAPSRLQKEGGKTNNYLVFETNERRETIIIGPTLL